MRQCGGHFQVGQSSEVVGGGHVTPKLELGMRQDGSNEETGFKDDTVFVTINDETGDVQPTIWPHMSAQCRRALSNQLIMLDGRIDRWDATTNIVAERIIAIGADIRLPDA